MTDLQHDLIKRMSRGDCYLMRRQRNSGRWGIMLYQGNANPERWYSYKAFTIVRDLCKTDKAGHMTLNLNLVRQEHGKSLVKILYKKQFQLTHHGTRSNKPKKGIQI